MALPNPSLAGRNGRIWKEYCRGATQEELAEKYVLSQQRVSQIINQIRDETPFEERDALVKQEVDLLRDLRKDVLELWDKPPNKAYAANGRELEGVEDHSGRIAAVKTAETLTARLHRVLGLDAPAKLDLNLTGEEEAARKAAAESLTRLHGGTEE